jgi:hypothetical protein
MYGCREPAERAAAPAGSGTDGAKQDRIQNPDLIHPGQTLVVPD